MSDASVLKNKSAKNSHCTPKKFFGVDFKATQQLVCLFMCEEVWVDGICLRCDRLSWLCLINFYCK